MNTKKLAYFLVISLVLGFSFFAYGAEDDTRYLVKSHSNIWKKSFGVRHEFKDGFTTDLTDWQLKVARVFGVETIPVKKLNILPDASSGETVSGVKARPGGGTTTRIVPSDTVPWGVQYMHGNTPGMTSTSGGEGVKVAVLDTGVLRTHPDLVHRIAQCKDFTSLKTPIMDEKCDDKNGHGTHVIGTIAADGGDDHKGIYGVAPQADIYAYKVCGANGSCWSDDIASAITTASGEGANIISMSLGSDAENTLIKDAISAAVKNGVLVVAAAGNDGPDIGTIDYPGANADVIAVGAFDVDFHIADWSSRGINTTDTLGTIEEGDIEFAAPGVVIESTSKDGGYVIMSGTSMATPHIAGLAALEWQKVPRVGYTSASDTRDVLKKFSQDLSPDGEDNSSGYGFPHIGPNF